ncbi:Gag-Pol polyprotein [Nosema granulosis]|uniref:Gag-Pol polyprotein n=1 Tax=Nosema granulosis TaxID=83296 RepID=A0A9P6GWV6_9MICR|nr:Gag-Pol polyprotein [Nosema granulosis]
MEIKRGDLVLLGIDYFTRMIFGKSLTTKDSSKICDFIKEVHLNFPIDTLLTDNGREFHNEKPKAWCNEKGIKQIFSVPYYHQSNGRIERANRTIREALKHSKGPTKVVLANIIKNYNNSEHRGIGMTPNEGLKKENHEHIIERQEKYRKEFIIKK